MYSNANQTPTLEILDTTLSTVVFSLLKDCQNETSLTHSTDEGKRVHVPLRKSFQAVLRVTFVLGQLVKSVGIKSTLVNC